ncbi:transposase [Bernardetia sp.]|uniref:transposase n=1 Tax=Bernardetia sp. TaxID=1937974 RepID=UPI0025BAFCDB|nr:transposase [Bernardetia sp.]
MNNPNKKYRKSIRAKWWDYGWNGAYFITICTKEMQHFFGDIKDGKMILSNVGVIVDVLWHQIPLYHAFVELGEFVVMPNHIHGILILDKPKEIIEELEKDARMPVEKRLKEGQGKNTVSSIIGNYKSAVTKNVNRLGLASKWQFRFHDHIIRNEKSYQRISNYILTNVENWEDDKFFN